MLRCVMGGLVLMMSADVALAAPAVVPGPTAAPGPVAGDSDRDQSAPPIAESRWYGTQILLADAAAMAASFVVASAFEVRDETGMKIFGVGFTVAGPTVHWLRGHRRRSLMSLGLRVALPAAAAYAAESMCTEDRTDDGPGCDLDFAVGGLAGYAVAVIADVALLSREKVAARAPASALRWSPMVRLSPGGASMGVGLTW